MEDQANFVAAGNLSPEARERILESFGRLREREKGCARKEPADDAGAELRAGIERLEARQKEAEAQKIELEARKKELEGRKKELEADVKRLEARRDELRAGARERGIGDGGLPFFSAEEPSVRGFAGAEPSNENVPSRFLPPAEAPFRKARRPAPRNPPFPPSIGAKRDGWG